MSKLGIPYMGSKRKLAHKIINKILLDNPNTKYFYDLFGGGVLYHLKHYKEMKYKMFIIMSSIKV